MIIRRNELSGPRQLTMIWSKKFIRLIYSKSNKIMIMDCSESLLFSVHSHSRPVRSSRRLFNNLGRRGREVVKRKKIPKNSFRQRLGTSPAAAWQNQGSRRRRLSQWKPHPMNCPHERLCSDSKFSRKRQESTCHKCPSRGYSCRDTQQYPGEGVRPIQGRTSRTIPNRDCSCLDTQQFHEAVDRLLQVRTSRMNPNRDYSCLGKQGYRGALHRLLERKHRTRPNPEQDSGPQQRKLVRPRSKPGNKTIWLHTIWWHIFKSKSSSETIKIWCVQHFQSFIFMSTIKCF